MLKEFSNHLVWTSEGNTMTPDEICAGYQAILRQAYPRAIVRKNTDDWIPIADLYRAFFIPDDVSVEYSYRWIDGWYQEAQARGLPPITLIEYSDSETKKHYSHLFPEIFGKTTSAKATRTAPKRAKSRPAKARARNAVASNSR